MIRIPIYNFKDLQQRSHISYQRFLGLNLIEHCLKNIRQIKHGANIFSSSEQLRRVSNNVSRMELESLRPSAVLNSCGWNFGRFWELPKHPGPKMTASFFTIYCTILHNDIYFQIDVSLYFPLCWQSKGRLTITSPASPASPATPVKH